MFFGLAGSSTRMGIAVIAVTLLKLFRRRGTGFGCTSCGLKLVIGDGGDVGEDGLSV
jgi:hypothetical protein